MLITHIVLFNLLTGASEFEATTAWAARANQVIRLSVGGSRSS